METSEDNDKDDDWKERLNRTMQYGNHKERQEEWVSFEGFKSYYVVWKL